jgi:hypothetical protein
LTAKHLRELLNAIPRDQEHLEIEVWLPGSRIVLTGTPFLQEGKGWLIEGYLKAGSALEGKTL